MKLATYYSVFFFSKELLQRILSIPLLPGGDYGDRLGRDPFYGLIVKIFDFYYFLLFKL